MAAGVGEHSEILAILIEAGMQSVAPVDREACAQHCLTIECYGARLGIRTSLAEALPLLPEYLPPGWQPTAARVDKWYSLQISKDGRLHEVRTGRRCIGQTADLEEALGTLASSLHFDVALRARDRLFVHAGVVGWRGHALVLPGRSGAGKTTLVEALLRAGATYFSDEYAVLDTRGCVHPYPKPLSIRVAGSTSRRNLPIEQLDRPAATQPWPLGLVAVTRYQPGRPWTSRTLTSGETLLALLDNTVVARLKPHFVLDVLGAAAVGVSALSATRGEADDAAVLLLSFLDQHLLSGERLPRGNDNPTPIRAALVGSPSAGHDYAP